MILLPQLLECWDYKYPPLFPDWLALTFLSPKNRVWLKDKIEGLEEEKQEAIIAGCGREDKFPSLLFYKLLLLHIEAFILPQSRLKWLTHGHASSPSPELCVFLPLFVDVNLSVSPKVHAFPSLERRKELNHVQDLLRLCGFMLLTSASLLPLSSPFWIDYPQLVARVTSWGVLGAFLLMHWSCGLPLLKL